jgi:hypothetical protein
MLTSVGSSLLRMEAASSFKPLMQVYHTKRGYILEDSIRKGRTWASGAHVILQSMSGF